MSAMNSRAKHRWITAGLVITAVGAALCIWRFMSSRRGDIPIVAAEQEQQIWVEACRPVSIRQPLEVARVGENGEKGLYCAPGGGLATENDGGDAAYRFYVPGAGRYRLWGYCRWLDEDTDGFAVRIGDGDELPIRKTGPIGQWQWLPLAEAQFTEGIGRLTLTAKKGGFALRRLFLCSKLTRHPLHSSIEPVDIFFDDFDGCEEGEFDSWNRVSGQWSVHRREGDKRPASNTLIGKSTSEALIIVGDRNWRDYAMMLDCCTVNASSEASVAVKFCCDQEGNGLVLRWTPKDAAGHVQMELIREEAAGVRTLDRFAATWDTSEWSELSIEVWRGSVSISIDSKPIRTINVGSPGGGAIGLSLQGDIEMMFDNAQVLGRRVRTAPATQGAVQAGNHHGNDEQETSTHDDEYLYPALFMKPSEGEVLGLIDGSAWVDGTVRGRQRASELMGPPSQSGPTSVHGWQSKASSAGQFVMQRAACLVSLQASNTRIPQPLGGSCHAQIVRNRE